MKGWQRNKRFAQLLTVHTQSEQIVSPPSTRPDQQMVFDAATDSVTMQTLDGETVDEKLAPRASFKGMLRNSAWDATHLGYFLGYACWNYFTTPFLFTYPAVTTHEIEPWREAGQTWRRLQRRFPQAIATHNPDHVCYFDSERLPRRLDYIAQINANT